MLKREKAVECRYMFNAHSLSVFLHWKSSRKYCDYATVTAHRDFCAENLREWLVRE